MNVSTAGFGPGLRYAFLVNPVSGSGKGRQVYDQLPKILEGLGLTPASWTRVLTTHGGVPEQSRQILETHDRLIVAGGDGTIGQVLKGMRLAGRPDAALGVIPLGTGNDLARELDLLTVLRRQGLEKLVATFLEDRVVPMDLWEVGGQDVLANYLSFGADGWITEAVGDARDLSGSRQSALRIKFVFVRAGLSSLNKRLPADFRLCAKLSDGTTLERDLGGWRSLLALNVRSYASGILRPVRTRSDDGLLTLMAVPRLWNYVALAATSRFPGIQAFLQRRFLPVWQATSFEVSWSGPNALQIDGEGRRDLLAGGRLEVVHVGRMRFLSGRSAA
jgi:diacylglycerol kinase (ATP)